MGERLSVHVFPFSETTSAASKRLVVVPNLGMPMRYHCEWQCLHPANRSHSPKLKMPYPDVRSTSNSRPSGRNRANGACGPVRRFAIQGGLMSCRRTSSRSGSPSSPASPIRRHNSVDLPGTTATRRAGFMGRERGNVPGSATACCVSLSALTMPKPSPWSDRCPQSPRAKQTYEPQR